MDVVEFKGPDQIKQIKGLAEVIKLAENSVRVAIDSDGFKVSVDYFVWSPGFGERKP